MSVFITFIFQIQTPKSKRREFICVSETGGTTFFLSCPVPSPAKKVFYVPSRPVSREIESHPVPSCSWFWWWILSRVWREIFLSHRDQSSLSAKTLRLSWVIVSWLKSNLIIHFHTQPAQKNLSTIAGENKITLYSRHFEEDYFWVKLIEGARHCPLQIEKDLSRNKV